MMTRNEILKLAKVESAKIIARGAVNSVARIAARNARTDALAVARVFATEAKVRNGAPAVRFLTQWEV